MRLPLTYIAILSICFFIWFKFIRHEENNMKGVFIITPEMQFKMDVQAAIYKAKVQREAFNQIIKEDANEVK